MRSGSSRRLVIQDNWRAFARAAPVREIWECPICTDAWIIGEVSGDLGPYSFLNLVSTRRLFGAYAPAVVLRVKEVVATPDLDGTKTDTAHFHGGSIADELSALAALALGVRMKAGAISRLFVPGKDPLGRPVAWGARSEPVVPRGDLRTTVLPRLVDEHNLENLQPLRLLPSVPSADAIAFIRAARSYQDAMWISDSDPGISWLLLVSAMETVANRWRRTRGAATERLAASNPDLVEHLKMVGGPELVDRIAEEFSDSIGATQKLLDFVDAFFPAPPSSRPVEFACVPWTPADLRMSLKKVYGYRSKALHTGIPFPAPMCGVPVRIDGRIPVEKPLGLGASAHGGSWAAIDLPMHLHVFEHIARSTILRWWESVASPQPPR